MKIKINFKKAIAIASVLVLTGCGAVLKTPEIRDDEFQRELDAQAKLLADYKAKHGNSYRVRKKFSNFLKYDEFVTSTTDLMLLKSKDLCKYEMKTVGMVFDGDQTMNLDKIPESLIGYPQVYGLTKGFPAQKAGIKKGDLILTIDGKNARQVEPLNMLSMFAVRDNTTIKVYNTNTKRQKVITLRGLETCAMLAFTHNKDVMNANATGNMINFYPKLIDFLYKDDYINKVIAHEIAHNIMAHITRSQDNATAGKLLGLAISIAAGAKVNSDTSQNMMNLGVQAAESYSHEFEAEADYLAVYILARAGYNIDNVANTWRRMALLSSNRKSLSRTTSHPASPKRFVALQKTIAEVKRKIAKGLPLEPDFKESNFPEIMSKQMKLY